MSSVTLTRETNDSFSVSGVLQMDTVMSVLSDLNKQLSAESNIRIDFSGVTNSDSAAVALIIAWLAKAKKLNIRIQLVHLPQQILDIAKASDLLEILPID